MAMADQRQTTFPVPDAGDVRKSIYGGNAIIGMSLVDHDVRLRCLQGWFFRCSWSEKFRFVTEIAELTAGVYVIEEVLKCVDGIYTKDVIDSIARDRIIFPYDIIPTDDNRAMTALELFEVRQEDTLWFVNLDAASQIDVMVKLLKLGGGGLIFAAFKVMERIYKERKEMNMVLAAVDASIRELIEAGGAIKDEKESEKSVVEFKNEYTVRKEEQMSRRNAELNEFRKKYGLTPGNGKKRDTTEVVDYIQVLPIWLNRKIMLYLNEKDLGDLKRTGKYWTKMIEDAVRERTGRVAIDAKIERIGGCGVKHHGESADEIEDAQDVPVLGRDALLAELHLRHSDLVRIRKEMKSTKDAKMEVTVWEETCFERIVCCANGKCKLLAASTSNKAIRFYSLRTGVRTTNAITSVQSVITSLTIHDEGFHVIVGCEDGSLFCMNIRKNERTITYKGHSGPVLRVHASDDKLVSAAEDRTIKEFDLWSGLCLLCVNIDDSITSMIVLETDSNPRCAIAGTAQGKLVFIDLRKKKIYREVVVHEREVKGIAEVESLLVTHSADRTIRMWSMNHLEIGKCGEIRPFASIRLKSVATVVECLGNEIFAACADGKVRLICKLTGAATRVVEVTQKKPIAGIYVMQEKDTTKMIMWHEGGIEMRSFSAGKVTRKKKKKATEAAAAAAAGGGRRKDGVAARREAGLLSRRKIFSVVPRSVVHFTLKAAKEVKRYKATNVEDREKVQADRSCTARVLRDIGVEKSEIITGDVFTEVIKKFQVPGEGELTTFMRLRNKDSESAAADTTSIDYTDESSF